MRILVLEDQIEFNQKLCLLIEKQNTEMGISNCEILRYSSASKLISDDNYDNIDIAFLDIDLGEMKTGLSIGRMLKNNTPDTILFFVTSIVEYVPDVFRIGAFHMLIKPVDEKIFIKDYKRVIDNYKQINYRYILDNKDNITVLKYRDIYYIEYINRRLYFHTRIGNFDTASKISQLEVDLNPSDFIRCHNSFIVNMSYIIKIGKSLIYLQDGGEVPLSKPKRQYVLERFNKFLARTL